MKLLYFTHSLQSCWNHGNAHFLRGVLRELQDRAVTVLALEPFESWSRTNLEQDHGPGALESFGTTYPTLRPQQYRDVTDLASFLADANVVIAHEWNPPWLIAHLAQARRQGARFTLLFHDTHHRAVSDPDAMRQLDLDGFDAVLAFGATLAQVYRRWGWGDRAFIWHEAADTRLFHPPAQEKARSGLVWIGNWGDDERGEELERFLLAPAHRCGLPLDVFGVRYPPAARAVLARHGAVLRGWLPNVAVPSVFARHAATVHVPRRFYATALPGIPTIRVFEALACGIPLLSAPWDDSEGLFRPGQDFLLAQDGIAMERHMRDVTADPALRRSLVASGLERIRARHSCAHRAEELLGILARLGIRQEAAA